MRSMTLISLHYTSTSIFLFIYLFACITAKKKDRQRYLHHSCLSRNLNKLFFIFFRTVMRSSQTRQQQILADVYFIDCGLQQICIKICCDLTEINFAVLRYITESLFASIIFCRFLASFFFDQYLFNLYVLLITSSLCYMPKSLIYTQRLYLMEL